MLKVLSGDVEARNPVLMDRIYRFRHDFFVDHLKWEACRKPDGRERDQFDGPDCLHVVGQEPVGRQTTDQELAGQQTAGQASEVIVSYSRLLPTTRPHLQTHLYPELLKGASAPSGPRIYEWTRCAVAPAKRESAKGVDAVSGASFTAVAEAAEHFGLEGLLVQTHPVLVTRLMEMGWDVEPLALPCPYGDSLLLPIYARLTPETVATCRRVFGLPGSVLRMPAPDSPRPAARSSRRPMP
ncbi:autoinducer synthase [Methylobacterium sp. Leaf469]|uniref:acyl-homoserine-lactone synthase n=1 Tax=unclassified Methylobacterium TaxID=2615210 RepID=UPI0006F2975D|nr:MULTISPECIES: acyl-homoserine-lactone synthase [unclassified Methylobacterium]KQO64611.1 autoinducer synthase [Methylobacterium sp. Leaf87]KQP30958.1 autoinducer synthase [Methylobacterium sp. Leaf100]KQU02316.1 autoinducer synthase [Methylobacterium sp. Leaf469]